MLHTDIAHMRFRLAHHHRAPIIFALVMRALTARGDFRQQVPCQRNQHRPDLDAGDSDCRVGGYSGASHGHPGGLAAHDQARGRQRPHQGKAARGRTTNRAGHRPLPRKETARRQLGTGWIKPPDARDRQQNRFRPATLESPGWRYGEARGCYREVLAGEVSAPPATH
ncbi:hypothetical protein FQZ97_981200 [compost metagenome]